jgi:hypothetical protein
VRVCAAAAGSRISQTPSGSPLAALVSWTARQHARCCGAAGVEHSAWSGQDSRTAANLRSIGWGRVMGREEFGGGCMRSGAGCGQAHQAATGN